VDYRVFREPRFTGALAAVARDQEALANGGGEPETRVRDTPRRCRSAVIGCAVWCDKGFHNERRVLSQMVHLRACLRTFGKPTAPPKQADLPGNVISLFVRQVN
jgi:hypothetical protein